MDCDTYDGILLPEKPGETIEENDRSLFELAGSQFSTVVQFLGVSLSAPTSSFIVKKQLLALRDLLMEPVVRLC